MDNGEVIPGLNDGWTFLGAKLMEWVSGLMMALMIAQMFGLTSTHAPIFAAAVFGTTFGLRNLRQQFPDEEKGIANMVAANLGFAPPKIPKPAGIQPIWSGAPIKTLSEKKEFVELGLAEALAYKPEEEQVM